MTRAPSPRRSQGALIRRGVKMTQLQLVAAIAETGQVLAAAERVGMTQPAASRLLAQLQEAMGTPLFDRHPRGVKLTEAGEILARGAARMLNDLDLTQERIVQTVQGARGFARIGSVTGPSLQWLLPVVRDLRAELPEIELVINVDTSAKLARALLSRELDFYIGRVPEGADGRPFHFRPMQSEPISMLVRQDHPLTWLAQPDLSDCLAYDWVMQPAGGLLRQTIESYLRARGHRPPDRVLGTTSILFTLAFVQDSDAIAPVASAVADFYARDTQLGGRLEILNVAPDLHVETYGLVRRDQDELPPAAEQIHARIAAMSARARP